MTPEEQLDLLRRFEPVIRYTKGELFLPMSVEEHVAGVALVAQQGNTKLELAPRGSLTIDRLAELGREHDGKEVSLERVDRPLGRKEFRAWRKRPERVRATVTSRFAVVGLLSRMIDVVLRLTLILRGRVPGGFTAAAELAYRGAPGHDCCHYYGHVTEDGGYLVLQYWYFYAMNDWRSTFGGVNDHEADWEQVTIFLVERDGSPEPVWVAFSSHDEVGDDLRRRWDDPDVEHVGEHPVVYAGAGSHSGAYLRGEYVVTAELPLPGFIDAIRRWWWRVRHPGDEHVPAAPGIPYIDYRRGDGVAVGVGGDRPWTAVVIDDSTPWVRDFRGLWGLDTRDRLGGERAPAGPRYERNGSVRESWGQPVAWAGLDKEAPAVLAGQDSAEHIRATLDRELAGIEQQLGERRELLRTIRSADRAAGRSPRRPSLPQRDLRTEVAALRVRQRQLVTLLEDLDRAPSAPVRDEVHAHLTHRATPLDPEASSHGRLVRFWSAASASVVLGALGVMLLRGGIGTSSAFALAGVLIVIESAINRRIRGVVVGLIVVGLAVGGARAVLDLSPGKLSDWLGVLLVAAAVVLLAQTVREGTRTR